MSNTNEMTSGGCFFKPIDEKHLSQEVKQMLWNPRMDLIALAFTNGDVHLYRMYWQKDVFESLDSNSASNFVYINARTKG